MICKKFTLLFFFLIGGLQSFSQIPDSLVLQPLSFYEKEQFLQKKHLQILQSLQKNSPTQAPEPNITPDLFRRQYSLLKNQTPFMSASQKPISLNLRRPPVPKNMP